MSALLKAGNAGALSSVRRLEAAAAGGPSDTEFPPLTAQAAPETAAEHAPPDREEELARQCAELEATVAALRAQIEDAEADTQAREDAAFEKGCQQGLDEAAGEAGKRLDLLAAALGGVLLSQV